MQFKGLGFRVLVESSCFGFHQDATKLRDLVYSNLSLEQQVQELQGQLATAHRPSLSGARQQSLGDDTGRNLDKVKSMNAKTLLIRLVTT